MDNSSLRIPVIREEIHWPALIAAVSAITAVGIAIGLGLPLLSIILEKRGVSSSMIGLNSAMAGVAAMVAAPLSTMIAQRLSVVTTMVLSIVAASVSALGFYYAEALWMWFPLRIVFHGAITILFVLSEFWINTAAPPKRRGLVLGIYATVLSLGFAAGPLIFSVIGSDGILPFLIGAGIILLAAVPIIMARKENPAIDTPPDLPFLRYVFLVPTATAAVFIFGAVESGGLSLFPVYANRTGFTESQGALLLMMMGLGNVLFQIPIGLIADRMKDRRPLLSLFAFIGLAGSLALPFLIHDWLLTAVILLFWGGSVAGLYTVGLAHLGDKLHGSDLAAANAAFVFCYALGMLVGPQTIGVSMDVAGNHGFAWALAFFFALYVALTLFRIVLRPKRT
ncbi:MFS transporter [Hoeflea alexandrii]|jgi:MFS family permease|uniref:MFS transporter n=1 Tax=Hoeflea TaxID=274591 RepID=UPI001253D802|nr:MFS transporter [Hoeflea sp. EC-HK425]MBV6648473.1 MFS transporter [Hoeflea sp.]VVT16864.1 MFS transporter [Hoeflea sp. EC-HK425]|tara:strand:- start:1205 stop:2389 length:1185 start_codon:yes stop_codon:yes gene_type:complete